MTETISNANAASSTLFLGHNGEWWDSWLITSLVAAAVAAIAVGVTTAGSIFSHKREAAAAERALDEYKLETGKKIAEAEARTAEAQLALEKLKAPRNLSADNLRSIRSKLEHFDPVNFGIGVLNGGIEPGSNIVDELGSLLMQSLKWKLVPVTGRPNSRGQPVQNTGVIAIIGISGIKISLDVEMAAELGPIASALAEALNEVGINAEAKPNDDGTPNAIFIAIGAKI
jgi:hypothetical protein